MNSMRRSLTPPPAPSPHGEGEASHAPRTTSLAAKKTRIQIGVIEKLPNGGAQLLTLVGALAIASLTAPGFFAITLQDGRLYGSIVDIANRGAPVALLAIGMALVIATRGIDLSVGAVMAIAGATAAAAVNAGAPWQAAACLGLLAGLACGLWNGALVALLNIQPFVATLILMVAGRGVAQLITEGRILTFVDPHLASIGSGALFGLPTPAVIALGAAIATIALFRGAALGLFVEAIGINPRASRLSGIGTRGVLMSVYCWSGLMAGIAGVIVAADIRGADANNAGLWLELDAILAAVIGGASLFGGRFSVSLALLGAIVIQTIKTGILRSGLPPEFNMIAMAAAIAIILALQSPAMSQFAARLSRRGEEHA